MIPIFRRQSEETGGAPRVNIVAIVILLASMAIGALLSGPRDPLPLIGMTIAGLMGAAALRQQALTGDSGTNPA